MTGVVGRTDPDNRTRVGWDKLPNLKAALLGGFFKAPSGDLRDQLLGRQSLGVFLDLNDLQKTLATMHDVIKSLVLGWVKDSDDLAVLVGNWAVAGWEPYKNNILSAAAKPVFDALVQNENYSRCSSGAALLNQWRANLKALNHDGCGAIVDVAKMKEWSTIVKSASECCEMSYAIHQITHTIPLIKNINLRKANARVFQRDMESRFDIGDDLGRRLKCLVSKGVVVEDSRGGAHETTHACPRTPPSAGSILNSPWGHGASGSRLLECACGSDCVRTSGHFS